ncbi:hypothetical protein H2248_000826 [Termitomyces sp. 'cryptogamus']|nr:hypothetical protein H2248_000826 [Termitomyces sp. 'cryptogamus']
METIPRIVVETCLRNDGTPSIYVLVIRRGIPPDLIENRITKIIGDCSSKPDQDSIVLPNWPFDDTYCFAWPHPHRFSLLPDAKELPAHWKISSKIAASLYQKYNTLFPSKQRKQLGIQRFDPLPGGEKVYVQILPLAPHTLQTSEGSR